MRIPTRHWLDYDSAAFTVLMIAISILNFSCFAFEIRAAIGVNKRIFCDLHVQSE